MTIEGGKTAVGMSMNKTYVHTSGGKLASSCSETEVRYCSAEDDGGDDEYSAGVADDDEGCSGLLLLPCRWRKGDPFISTS